MEITREDILKEGADTVDSTTDVEPSPVKKLPPAKSAKMARMSAARGRARSLLSSCMLFNSMVIFCVAFTTMVINCTLNPALCMESLDIVCCKY